MKSELCIRTPEGVAFSYRLAGPVARGTAWMLDLAVILVLGRGLGLLSGLAGLASADAAAALTTLGYFVVSLGYGVATEWAGRGQTLGKRLLRLRVMDAQGLKLQFRQVLLRNLLRAVDLLPACYLVGGVTMLASRRAQRLGDLAANTMVVHHARQTEPDLDQLLAGKFNSLRQHPHLAARLRQRASPEEAGLALQALVRRDELEPAARVALFSELAAHFKTLVAFPAEDLETMPDEQFMRNVVDVLFRTRRGAERPVAR